MTAIEYLCIDDQRDRQIQQLLDLLSDQGTLRFERRSPQSLELQIRSVGDRLRDITPGNIFALLLDLRLDMEADSAGDRVPYRGPTLAQELRTRMAEGELPSFPIVLWSINQKFAASFSTDDTSRDLFDAVYGKDEAVVNDTVRVQSEMRALAIGYQEIANTKQLDDVVKVLKREAARDFPVYGEFFAMCGGALRGASRHELARIILNSLIRREGLLVDDNLVAARFGIDKERSGESWSELLELIRHCEYVGPFCNGWKRWWWYDLEDWWFTLDQRQPNLRRLGAADRVGVLNKKLRLALEAANTMIEGYSDRFFAVCVATGRPIDPVDGLQVLTPNSYPWNEPRFVSGYAALERINKDSWKIHPSDRARYDQLKGRERG